MKADSKAPIRTGRSQAQGAQPSEKASRPPLSAMILAAGKGSRLFPLTHWLAKPAVPFLGRPLIHYAMDLVHDLQPTSLVVNLHHLPHTVVAAVGRYRRPGAAVAAAPLEVSFSEEAEILGTAGAIRRASRRLQGDHTVVINGKIYSELALAAAFDFHCNQQALATLVVVPFQAGSPFNPVRLDGRGQVLGFGPEGPGRPHTFTGIQILKNEVIDRIPRGKSDLVKDLYPALMREKSAVRGHVSRRFWCECSTPWRYLQGSLAVSRRERGSRATGGEFRPDSGWIAPPECSIGRGARLRHVILWEDVSIGSGCRIRNAIICSGVKISDRTRLSDAIITPRIDPGSVPTGVRRVEKEDYLVWPLTPE